MGFREVAEKMDETGSRSSSVINAVCDAFNQIGDVSYALMPRDIAHAVGDLKKAVLTNLRGAIDCETGWITDRVAGGDRLRDEWREKCRRHESQNVSSN